MTCVSIFLWHLAARPGVEMKIVPCLDHRLLHLFRLHPDKAKSPGQSGKGSSQGGQPVRVCGKPRAKQSAKQPGPGNWHGRHCARAPVLLLATSGQAGYWVVTLLLCLPSATYSLHPITYCFLIDITTERYCRHWADYVDI